MGADAAKSIRGKLSRVAANVDMKEKVASDTAL
jgi:hypothetical protein